MNEKEIQEDRNGTEISTKTKKQINRDKKECVVEYEEIVGLDEGLGRNF